jgi:hypothetical protein
MTLPRRGIRTVLGVAFALLVAALAAGGTPMAATASTPGPLDTAAATGLPAAPHVVTLITGDRVALSTLPDGKPLVTLSPADRGGAPVSFQTLTAGGHVYVIPHDAAGFIGGPLDVGLFDVTNLVAQGYDTADAVLPLDVTYESGTTRQALPGLTPTGAATAVETKPNAAKFGRALDAEWLDAKKGVHGGLFDGIERIALAGTGAEPLTSSPPGQPSGKLYTLTVKGFDRLGHKATGDLGDVMSVDDVNTFLASQSFFNGTFAYSVPAGTYMVAAYIATLEPDGTLDWTLVTLPEVTVKSNTVVVLDARKGNRIGAQVPDPTSQFEAVLSLQRNSVVGPGFTTTFITQSSPVYATPTAPVDKGALYFYPYLRLGDPDGTVNRYLYDLEFPYAGAIPRDLEHTIGADQLATVDAAYHSAVPGRRELEARIAELPWQLSATAVGSDLSAPLARTEYVLPQPDTLWLQYLVLDEQTFSGFSQDIWRAYRPGEHTTNVWTAQPEPAGIQQETQVGQVCPACRQGDTLSLALAPFGDNGGHFEFFDPNTSMDLRLYQDGSLVGEQPFEFARFPMSPDPASYQLVFDVHRQTPWWPTSTDTHTEWTFPSQERAPDPMPPGWTCGKGGKGGGGGGCSFEPLLFVAYDTHAGTDDVVPAGTTATLDLTVHHQEYAPDTPIAGLSLSVSFDDGGTWSPVDVTDLGGGHFRATYPQPPLEQTSGFASLRVEASDTGGSQVDQTVVRAYPLSVTPPLQLGSSSGGSALRACAAPAAPPYAQCMALVRPGAGLDAQGAPSGYGPLEIQGAYKLPAGGQGETVAVIDAYDDPSAEADLAAYRAAYGLPACTTANGCFRKVNQRGDPGPLPDPDPGWGLEVSLDLDAVSAACPRCDIVLVEADSASLLDLGPAVDTAVALGADAVSNSYGTRGEFSGEQYFERYYKHSGVAVTASSGDYGYGNGALLINSITYPAASQFVTAVGGTSLTPADNARRWQEAAWDGAGSGCSAYIHKPGWQHDRLCGKRTVADVAAVADPQTGLAVYDTYGFGGWLVVGGTSASSPIVASVYALAGNSSDVRYGSFPYGAASGLFDVVAGSNGTCGGTYLCTAVPGFDGPTGLGTPNGTDGF